MTEFENTNLIYVYVLKQTNTRHGLNFTFKASISDVLNEEIEIIELRSNSYLSSQSRFHRFEKIEFTILSAHGSFVGCHVLAPIKEYNFTSKGNRLSTFLQTHGINSDFQEEGIELVQTLSKLDFF